MRKVKFILLLKYSVKIYNLCPIQIKVSYSRIHIRQRRSFCKKENKYNYGWKIRIKSYKYKYHRDTCNHNICIFPIYIVEKNCNSNNIVHTRCEHKINDNDNEIIILLSIMFTLFMIIKMKIISTIFYDCDYHYQHNRNNRNYHYYCHY